MKFWEAIKALEEGKAIRRQSWPNYSYVVADSDGEIIMDRRGDPFSIGWDIGDDWEIYEESKPKKQVWQWRYKPSPASDTWQVSSLLLSENEVKLEFCGDYKYEKHAGPFEVEE